MTRRGAHAIVAIFGLAAGCSPSIDGGDGSFESGPGASTAPADDDAGDASTGDEEETTTGDTGDALDAVACQDYLACLTALASDQLGAMQDQFGPQGSCFETQSSQACDDQCGAALEALLAAVDPAGLPTACGGAGGTVSPENTDAACRDGNDNDGNGFIDCDDPGCTTTPGVTACVSTQENTNTACEDGSDNDGDSFVDCDDFDCAMNPDVTVCLVDEDNQAACSDSIDNDGDGFVDCDDFDCSMNPAVSCTEDSDEACSDDADNDGDGFLDCDDFDCSMNDRVTVCG